jgi:hypothetical protein
MTEFRSELGIAPSPMGIYGIAVPDSYPHLIPHFSRSSVSPLPARRQFLCASMTEQQALVTGASLWERRSKCGMTPAIGVVWGGVDAPRRKRLDRRLFPDFKFAQQTPHIVLPRQVRALKSGVPERALELLSYGGTALSDHDRESR